MRAVVHLVIARLTARRRAGTLMIPAAVAGAVMVLLGSGVVSLVAQDATLRGALERASPADRTVRVDVFKTGNPQLSRDGGNPALTAADEAAVRGALPGAAGRGPVGEAVVYSEISDSFGERRVVAVDDLAARVRLRSGRLPRSCSRSACEVLLLGGARVPPGMPLGMDGLRLTATGRGDLDAQVAGKLPPPGVRPQLLDQTLYLVVPSMTALAMLEALEFKPRRYSFSRELDPAAVHPWTVDDITRDLRRARARLGSGVLQTELHAPDRQLGSERVRGVVAERRLLIIAGLAAAALLGFAVLAATLRRHDVDAELARLRDAGAQAWQQRVFVLLEAGLLSLAGVLAGVAMTAVLVAVLGAVEAGDPGLFLREALLDGGTLLVAGTAFASATLILAGTLGAGGGRRSAGSDLVPAAVLALLVWQASERGALGPSELAAGSSAPPELLLLPGLLAFAAALLSARLCGPVLRRLERAVRPAGVTVQLAVLSLVRRPGRTSAAAGFLAAGVTLGLFALSHADALRTGARDSAAFAAGADVRVAEAPVREGEAADVRPLARYSALPGVRAAVPALRTRAELLSPGRGVGRAIVLGLPGEEMRRFPALRAAAGTQAARLRAAGGDVRLEGDVFPAGTRELRLRVSAHGAVAKLALVVEDAAGRVVRLGFLDAPMPRARELRVRAPRGGGRVVGVELTVVAGESATAAVADVRLGALRASGGAVVTRFGRGWVPTTGAQAAGPGRFRFETATTTGSVGLVARQPEGGRPVPAIVSRALAAEADADGVLPIRLATGEIIRLRVAGTAPRVPTAGRDFVLFDLRTAYRAINGMRAGTVAVNEMWLRTEPGADAAVTRALDRPPFRTAEVTSRAALTARVEADAVARSAIGALWAAAALALAIAACGLALTVSGALADGGRELSELEVMGATPRELRRQLRLGALVVGAGGAAMGAGGAALLSALFTALVHVSADGRDPLPPLGGGVAWGVAAAALATAAALAAVWVGAVTGRAFRADVAGRAGG